MSNTNTTYKQTPIGLIPSDWEVKKLGEIILEARLGGNYENSENNEGIPVIKMGNISRGGISIDKVQYLPLEESYNEEDILKEGDLLFNTRNTLDLVGKVAVWKNEIPFALYNSNLLRLKFKPEFVASNWYMNYSFNSFRSLSQLRGFATGTTSVAAIYSRDLNHLKLPLPPLPEQQKIATILSTWDTAIDNCKAIIEKLKERNKGLAQLLLTGKKRVKGFENTKWKIYSLDDITENFSRRNKELVNARIYSVTNNNGFVLQSDHFSREVAGDDLNNYKIIKKNEFAYNPARINVGSIAYFENEIGIISSLYVCFRSKNQVLDKFLLYWLSIEKTQHDISRYGEGGVRIYLWFELFATIKIELPQIDEQDAILKILDAASAELNQYQEKLEQLQLQKKGLMQQLLTGKIRVNVN